MSKITLSNVSNLIDATTATNTINSNSNVLAVAMDNTLSRDGTSPNQMLANIDMNSNKIINLPVAISTGQPITYEVFNSAVIGKGNVPLGGFTGQILTKKSTADLD